MNKIAAVLFSFNRPNYLIQALTSLENCVEIDDIDFYLYQDNAINKWSKSRYAEDEDINTCIKVLEDCKLPNKFIHINNYNLSIAHQKYEAYKLYENYDLLFFFQDDFVVSKYYIRLLKIMAKQFPTYIGNCYWYGKNLNDDLTTLIKSPGSHFFGLYMWKNVYEQLQPEYEIYIDQFVNCDYTQRPDKKITNYFGSQVSSQDSVTKIILERKGYIRIIPAISRGKNIGQKGLHSFPGAYNKRFIEDVKGRQYEFPEDATLKKFKLLDKELKDWTK